jgi:two-component system nitrate/nitrite response regulator NarL
VLSGFGEPELPAQALEAGASGFAGKDVGVDRLVSIIGRILRGEVVSSPSRAWHDRDPRAGELRRLMTARERAVLERLVQGMETSAISTELGISYTTTRAHIQNLLTKLGVHSKLELVATAVTFRLVPPPRRVPAPASG